MRPIRQASLSFLFSLITAAALSVSSATAEPRPMPNVLIFYADDLGYGDLSGQNPDSKIPTPHLDALAEAGARFTDAHSTSGICTPSRYALLTGRFHWRDFHGIVKAMEPSVFKDEQLTMPEMFQEKGYTTACIGKWHLGWDWEAIRIAPGNKPESFDWTKPIPDGPLAHGFDHYFGDTVINFPPYAWIEDDKMAQIPDTMMDTKTWPAIKEGNWECRPGPMVTGWNPYDVLPTLADKGVAYIESRKDQDQPFFLYFSFPCPHAPIIPNDEFDGTSEAGPYGDLVVQTDDIVGRMLKALDQAGLAEDTIVIFMSDNGPEHYAYARDRKFDHWSSAPFRGLKRDIYEGGHHVPFIMRWPGQIDPGTTYDALISQVDLFATFASVLDYELPDAAAADSLDMLDYLAGKAESVRDIHVHNTFKDQYAIRVGDWLLVDRESGYHSRGFQKWEEQHGYPPEDGLDHELYNFAEDPEQRHNLAAKHPEIVERLRATLKETREAGRSRPAGE